MPNVTQRKAGAWPIAAMLLLAGGAARAQISTSAYRVLGQADFRQAGVNMVQGTEFRNPSNVALDARGGQLHLYVTDTGNSRVLAWADVASYQNGDAPALVLGQPGPEYSAPMGIGVKGFNGPLGLAVDPTTGNLYVADFGNNRVLRFAAPFANPARIEPDAVYGQSSFETRGAAATSSGLNQPRSVAFDSTGNLWVADAGNNRVVRFAASSLNNTTPPPADAVIGQADFGAAAANAGKSVSASGFDTPVALAFDAQDNLYVSDFQNTRVLKFSAPLGPANRNPAASAVWGEANFTSRGVPVQANASTMTGPLGLSIDSNSLYVAVANDNRVLVFPLSPGTGVAAKLIVGQSDPASTAPNVGARPLASPNSLSAPTDVKVDAAGNLFVADNANHRVLEFPPGTKSATRVWGQPDFVCNGANRIKAGSIRSPYKMAIDYSATPFALYVSDTLNNRVLVWRDSVRFRNGDPADLVIGQPNMGTAAANVDTQGSANPSATSLNAPGGIALNQHDGTLYVADSKNNRVLRYPRPVDQPGRITPDAVIGQTDFTSSASAAVSATSLNAPTGVAIGPNGDLFVADSNNNRVLEYASGAGMGAAAIRVFGQPGMTSSVRPSQVSAQTLSNPQGIAVDQAMNLYVADGAANRVLVFPNTQSAEKAGTPATFVLGQANFGSAGTGGAGNFKLPTDVAVDSAGNIYVADAGDNRVLAYQSLIFLSPAASVPTGLLGQPNLTSAVANWNSTDGLATPEGLAAPIGLYVDRQNTLYVGDSGNSRVLQFLKAAAVVNSATYLAGVPVAQGALVSLFGSGLAAEKASAAAMPWPKTLAKRQIVINDDLQAPLWYVDSGQVNFQMPSAAPIGSIRLAIRIAETGELVAGGSVLVAAASPGIFTSNMAGTGQAAVYNENGARNGPLSPAPAGSTITLYGTGQGQVSPAVDDGAPAPGGPLAYTVAVPTSSASTCQNSQPSMCVVIGNALGTVTYSGLAPGWVGLWQINVTIPPGTPAAANVPVRVIINGSASNTATIAVK